MQSISITAVSDLHGHYPSLPGGDLLILAGDYTANDTMIQWASFISWLKKQNYRKKILISGNHDNFLFTSMPHSKEEVDELNEVKQFLEDSGEEIDEDFEYLCNSGTEFEGIKIWGTPHSLWFPEINPHCMAFTGDEISLKEKYDLIPTDTDILISHTPFWMALDDISNYTTKQMEYVGSKSLRKAVDRVMPDIFICGHIHENGGKELIYKGTEENTKCFNVSYVNEYYKPSHNPRVINYEYNV